mmetsp:Transcript_16049/g.23468  ORF Transcript_16049/g.23468 Transcript_16049/m.23468 type:complete len:91 (-) Transcript_16049:453-725(-)
MTRFIDMTDMQLLKVNRTYVKRDAAAFIAYEDFFPQFLGAMLIFNSTGWLRGFWILAKPFFQSEQLIRFFSYLLFQTSTHNSLVSDICFT